MCGAASAQQSEAEQQLENRTRSSPASDRDLKNNAIDTRVEDGVATLTGTVDTVSER
jgi:hypothetical protein